MSNTDEMKEAMISMEEAKEGVALRDAVLRLFDNADFKAVIHVGYFRDEAARMTLLMGDPRLPDSAKNALSTDVYGPGALRRYLSSVCANGNQAEKAIEELRELIDEMNDDLVN